LRCRSDEHLALNPSAARRHASVSEIGDAENISKSYVSRILRLALLAPDIVEAILDGRQSKWLRLAEALGNGPLTWEEQRSGWDLSRGSAACL
jgi:hypothetical protein